MRNLVDKSVDDGRTNGEAHALTSCLAGDAGSASGELRGAKVRFFALRGTATCGQRLSKGNRIAVHGVKMPTAR